VTHKNVHHKKVTHKNELRHKPVKKIVKKPVRKQVKKTLCQKTGQSKPWLSLCKRSAKIIYPRLIKTLMHSKSRNLTGFWLFYCPRFIVSKVWARYTELTGI
jgi:hypothetical protein